MSRNSFPGTQHFWYFSVLKLTGSDIRNVHENNKVKITEYMYNVGWTGLDGQLITKLHDLSRSIFVWTILPVDMIATDRSDKDVFRLEILMDNSLAVNTVHWSSKTTPELICNTQRDRVPLLLIQLQCVLNTGFCYDHEMTIVWIRVLGNCRNSVHLQCCRNDWVACETETLHNNQR